MYFDGHLPPHFHTAYGDDAAVAEIDALAVWHGPLTPRAQGLLVEGAYLHQVELREAWNQAKHLESTDKIGPLE